MLDVLIWNKYARVVMLMAKKQGISPVEALDQFYNAPLFPALRDKDYPLITMGDEWICDNMIQQ